MFEQKYQSKLWQLVLVWVWKSVVSNFKKSYIHMKYEFKNPIRTPTINWENWSDYANPLLAGCEWWWQQFHNNWHRKCNKLINRSDGEWGKLNTNSITSLIYSWSSHAIQKEADKPTLCDKFLFLVRHIWWGQWSYWKKKKQGTTTKWNFCLTDQWIFVS